MKKGKPKLWKQIAFALIAFLVSMAIFVGVFLYRNDRQRAQISQQSVTDFEQVELVIDSIYIKPIYRLPALFGRTPESIREILSSDGRGLRPRFKSYYKTELTITTQNKEKIFRMAEIPRSISNDSELNELMTYLKPGDSISAICKILDLDNSKEPDFLSNYYYRYERPLVYRLISKGKIISGVGMEPYDYLDEKIHDETLFYSVIAAILLTVGLVAYKLNFIKKIG
ncbi:hypothetical protein Q4603_21615 [Zobellia galactanivorans]|uniref:hypothetical protein n=1 Tax=Zobellia galactanivorans (strain DSM 12802 / CCUG 47099 / CIP 106680 / NCIMB 13871 / Dsij) TaxID=63186 RepID=UPI0026E273B7|nr:hypothetical protein [Zobellia galactanivorans]MDO6811230.1 hypothetical protein [Zobellia galactanivorans]